MKNKKKIISMILVITFIVGSFSFKREDIVVASTSSDNYINIDNLKDISEPAVNGKNPVAVHTLYLTKDGYVYGEGRNNWGQLGQGHTNEVDGIVKIKDNGSFKNGTVVSIQTGNEFSMVLTSDGKVYGFGRSTASDLGFWSVDPVTLPREVSLENLGGSPVKKILASERVSTILSEDGKVYTAGVNANGTTMQDTLEGSKRPHSLISRGWEYNNIRFEVEDNKVTDIFEGSNSVYFLAEYSVNGVGGLTGLKGEEEYLGNGNLYDGDKKLFLTVGGDNRDNITGVSNPTMEGSPNVRPRVVHHINFDSPIVDVASTNYSTLFLTESGKLYRTRKEKVNTEGEVVTEVIKTPELVPNREGEDYKFINGETKIKKMIGGTLSGPEVSPLILAENGDLFIISKELTITRVRENVEDIFRGQRPFIKYKDDTLESFNTNNFNETTIIEPAVNVEFKESNLITVGSSSTDLRNMINVSINGIGKGELSDYRVDFLGVDLDKIGSQKLEIIVKNKLGYSKSIITTIIVMPESGVIGDVSKTEVRTLGSGLHHSIALSQDGDIYVVGQDGTYTSTPGGFGIPHPQYQNDKGVQYLENWTKVPLKAGDIIPPVSKGGVPGVLKESILDDDEYVTQVAASQVGSKILTNKGYVYSTGSDVWGGQANGEGTNHNATYKKIESITVDGIDIQGNVANIIQNNASGFIVTNDGYLYSFGSNRAGQLGLGNTSSTHTASYAIDTGFQGKVETVFSYHYVTSIVKTIDNRFFGAGNLSLFGMGDNTKFTELDVSKWDLVGDIEEVYINPKVGIIKSIDKEGRGYIYTLGLNDSGSLGINNTSISNSNIPVEPTDNGGSWDRLQGTTTMANAIIYPTSDGTFVDIPGGGLYSWGGNYHGMLGTGNLDNVFKPTLIDTSFLEGEEILFIVGTSSSLMMTESGRIFVAGINTNKQLGLGHSNAVYSFEESNTSGFNVEKPENVEVPLSIHVKYKDNKYIKEGFTKEQFIDKLLISLGGYKGTVDDVVISTDIDTSRLGSQEVTITAIDTSREESNDGRVATTKIDVEVVSIDGFSSSEVKIEMKTLTTVGNKTYVLSTDKKVYDLDGNIIVGSSDVLGDIIQIVGGSENLYFLTDEWIVYKVDESILYKVNDNPKNVVNTLPTIIQGTIANIYTVGEETYFLTHNGSLYSGIEFIRSGVKSVYPSNDNLVLKTIDGWELVDGKNLNISSEALEVYSKGETLIVKTKDELTVDGVTVNGFDSNEEFMEHSQISVGSNITVVINGVLYLINGTVATSITYNEPIVYANGNYVLTKVNDGSGHVHSLNGTKLEDVELYINGAIELPDYMKIEMVIEVIQMRRWFDSNDTQEDLEKSFIVKVRGNQGDVDLSYTGYDQNSTKTGTQEITITATAKDNDGNILQKVEEVVTINFDIIVSLYVNGEEVESDSITYSKSDTNEVITVTAKRETSLLYNEEVINSGDEIKLTEGKHEIRAINGVKQVLVTYIVDRTVPEKPTFNVANTEEGKHTKNTVWITDGYDLNVDYTEYKVGDGDFIKGNKVDLIEDGIYIISARTIDKVGHVSELSTMEITIDTKAPLLDVSGLEDGSFTRRGVRITAEDKSTPQEDLKLTVTKDGTVLEGVELGDTLNDDGSYVVTVTDLVGLSTALSFTIDKTLPIIVVKNGINEVNEYELIREVDNEGITITVTDTNLTLKEYSEDGGLTWTALTNETVFKGDNNYVIKAVDKASNKEKFAFSIATNIPKITIRFEEAVNN